MKRSRRAIECTLGALAVLLACVSAGCTTKGGGADDDPLEWTGPLADKVDYIVGDQPEALVRLQFRNRSGAGVKFLEAKSDCRCTSVALPEGTFEPGNEGQITFKLAISDSAGHSVNSRSFLGYAGGRGNFGRYFDLVVNKRKPLEIEPEILELLAVAGADRTSCRGQVKLTRYTTPGRPFDEYDVSTGGVQGEVEVVGDGGWSVPKKDAGYLRSERIIALQTKPAAPPSGTARLNVFKGSPPEGTNSLVVHWSQEELVSMNPSTVLLSKDQPKCQVTVRSHLGARGKLTWHLPDVIVAEEAEVADGARQWITTLGVRKGAARGDAVKTHPFRVEVECNDRKARVDGTIVILSLP